MHKKWLRYFILIGVTIIIIIMSASYNNALAAEVDHVFLYQKMIDNQKESILQGSALDIKSNYFSTQNYQDFRNKKLPKIILRLRDIGRFLSSKWPLVIELKQLTNDPINNTDKLIITDFRTSDRDWTSMTVGHALNLVAKELSVLEESAPDPLIDLLVRKQNSEIHGQILDVPLANYCYYLYQNLEKRKNQ